MDYQEVALEILQLFLLVLLLAVEAEWFFIIIVFAFFV